MKSDGLNPSQRTAVNTLAGPLLVLAGAGTGKTRVVTYRIANLIRSGVRPDRILAVTFTNKAAGEMHERIAGLLGKRVKAKPTVSTFHSQCVKILRRHIRQLGFPERFAILDRGEQESIARSVLREIRVDAGRLRPGELIHLIGGWKSRGWTPSDAAATAQTDKEHVAASGYRRYQAALKNRGVVDFDDLLLCTLELFKTVPDVLAEEAARFDHLLVDEYQDTNGSQYRIVSQLAAPHRNLCVVGDDDQSIYGWRGAEVEHILRFAKDWPDATVVRLEDNYRSTASILEMANRLIAFNKTRHAKKLRAARSGGQRPRVEQYKDETEEARGVVEDIARQLKKPDWEPHDFAILFRTNEQPRAFEAELRRQNLPYVLIGGMSFFDRKEVRDTLGYLKLIANPQDEVSLLRVINMPPRGISKATVSGIIESAVSNGRSAWEMVEQIAQQPRNRAETAVADFHRLVAHYRQRTANGSLVELLRGLLSEIGYEDELRRAYGDENEVQGRWAAVEELVNSLANYEAKSPQGDLLGFLDEVTLDGQDFDREKERQLRRNAITLMTLHSAKGLEYPNVYMVGMEEGLLPHRRSTEGDEGMIEEERRLCYVGVTRAMETLTLTMALARRKWGKLRETIPSRFLFELIGQAENPQQYHGPAKRSKPTLKR